MCKALPEKNQNKSWVASSIFMKLLAVFVHQKNKSFNHGIRGLSVATASHPHRFPLK